MTHTFDKTVPLKGLAQIFQGVSLSRYRDAKGSSERIVNVRNLEQLYIKDDLSVEKLIVSDLEKYQLYTNDVVISVRGSPMRASVVTDLVQGSLAGQNLAILRPKLEVIDPVYLAIVMRSEWLSRSLSKLYGLSTGTQLVKLSQLRDLKIFLPNLKTQNELAQLFLATERVRQVTLEKIETRQRQIELIISRILEGQQ